MGNFRPFYIWFVLTCVVGAIVAWLASKGYANLVYTLDVTHITQVIATIALISNFTVGFVAWKFATDRVLWNNKRARKWLKGVWFYSQQCFLWGILGTVSGSLILFYTSFNTSSPVALTLATLAPHLLPPLGIVFSATMLAIAAVILLTNQIFWFNALSNVSED